MQTLFQDVRYGLRTLIKTPAFAVIAIATLALGIGANSAIFSFVNAILLRPLPYKDPERLVMVFENQRVNGWFKDAVGAPVLGEWRRQNTVFEGLAARGWDGFTLTGKGQPENIPGSPLSANMFSLLGIRPIRGRDFQPEEETYGKHHVVLLSHDLWQRRFGRDTNIIGQSITLNAEPYTVVGVMPPRTFFPEPDTQLWTPLAFSPDQLRQRHAHNYLVYGRLKAGVPLGQARAEMDLIARRMADADEQNKGWGAEVYPLREIVVGDSRVMLLVLLCSVGLVLLIGCANIANLLLVRSAARAREFAIRAALGAGRGQMIRQLLTESLLLAICGGILGSLLAWAGLRALVRISPPDLPRIWEGIHLDGTTLLFTAAVTLATGVVFGLAPAWQASRPALAHELNESSRSTSASRHRHWLRGVLVIGEVAVSLTLLVSAGLMIRSFSRLVSQQLGYNPEHIVTMGTELPNAKYPEQGNKARFFEQFLAAVRRLPGVQSAALVRGLPLSGRDSNLSVLINSAPQPAPGESVAAGYSQVSPGYFHTMNIPLLQGRDFTGQDRTNTVPVVIVDETFVRNFKLGTNILGRRIDIGDGTDKVEIIGVVKDTKRSSLADAPHGEMYRTYKQMCWGYMTLVVQTKRNSPEITRAVRTELDTIDKDQPIENVRTMTRLVASSVAQRRMSVELLGGFAGVAMLLAAIGLYGVLAYNVAQRTQEIGIRMALGARRGDVLGLVLRHGMTLASIGITLGLAGALAVTRLLRSLLFGVSSTDPVTFVLVPLLLCAVAFLACWLPARRATKVDPMVALRNE
ncbi:MAG: ABC transporter permease [Verrucomicrobia bacterium]|nr:ABC transporter permease [Verrucomicrobiota bacterium]